MTPSYSYLSNLYNTVNQHDHYLFGKTIAAIQKLRLL